MFNFFINLSITVPLVLSDLLLSCMISDLADSTFKTYTLKIYLSMPEPIKFTLSLFYTLAMSSTALYLIKNYTIKVTIARMVLSSHCKIIKAG